MPMQLQLTETLTRCASCLRTWHTKQLQLAQQSSISPRARHASICACHNHNLLDCHARIWQASEHSTAHIATVLRQRGPGNVAGGFNVSAALQALSAYTTITRNYSDLALSQYAHVGRALMLYELGQWPESISELKSVEFRLRGYAEVSPCTFDACAAAVQTPYTSGF